MMLASSTPLFTVLSLAAWSVVVLLPQEGRSLVTASSNEKNDQELPVPTYPSSLPEEEHRADILMTKEGGSLENFNYYNKEPAALDVGTMTIHERVDAAEQFYQDFKRAVEELSQVDVGDFPELEELLQESVQAIEAMAEPITDSIHFLRLTAGADLPKEHDDNEVGAKAVLSKNKGRNKDETLSLEDNTTTRSSQGRRELLSPSLAASTKDGSGSTHTQRRTGRRASQSEARSRVGSKRKTKKSNIERELFGGTRVNGSNTFNPFTSIEDDLSKGGDHKKIMKKFIQSLQDEHVVDPAFSNLLYNPIEDHYMNDDDRAPGSRRRLKTKNEKCQQLAECASQMSLFDLFVSFHADDIDPVTGDVDENVVLFDEVDIIAKKARIDSMANQILQQGETVLCDDLLEEFHRTVEFDGIPQWEGSTISEVCLAEGTTTFVNLASLYQALVPDAFPEEAVLEELLDDMDAAIQQFMLGGGTAEQLLQIQLSEAALLNAIALPRRKEAFDLVNRLTDETVVCAEQLFDSSDRLGNPIFENESSLFSSFVPDLFDDTLLSTSQTFGGSGGVAFDDEDDLAAVGGINRITSINVFHDSFINGIEVTYLTNDGGMETRLHGTGTGTIDTIDLSDVVLTQVELRTGFKVDQITFIDSNLRVYGPYGGSGGEQRPALTAGDQKGIIAFHGRAGNYVDSLGIYSRQKLVFDDYFTKPTLAYQFPKGLSTGGVQGRTPHGQIKGGGGSPFTFTSTTALLQDYASCLDQVVGPIKGLVQVFERVHDLPNLQNGAGFGPCDNDPQNPFFICRELNEVGLLPIEDQNPFMCGSDGWVSYDGTFCCAAAVCDAGLCGRHCPNNSNSFFTLITDAIERKQCCEEDIRRNAFECSDSQHVGCKIKEGNRWYDIAIRQAREQFLEETESEKTCASDYFEAVQHGLGLVFGQRRSTPGYVCGIKSAVVDENKLLPGTCCLDAPYELSDEDWGSNYKCSMTCQNLAPYFSGMSEETCDVYGGTWCPQPTDCTTLQTCIDDLLVTAESESRLQAFAMYLSAAPTITDPTDYDQCGDTREYFGFDPDFFNDAQICDDVEQLRFSRDFMFLEEFLGEGSTELTPPGDSPELPDAPELPEDLEPEDVPPLELTPPDRTATESTPVQNGQRWRSTNFALQQQVVAGSEILRLTADVSCLLDFKFIKANICLKIRNVLIGKQSALVKLANLVLEISEFTYGELGEIDNVGQLAILENSDAIFGNMELMATYLQEHFMDLNWYIESETDTIKEILDDQNEFLVTTLDTKADFLADVTRFENAQVVGLLELLLGHFNITFQTRMLEGSSTTTGPNSDDIDGPTTNQQEEELHVASGGRDIDTSSTTTTGEKDHHDQMWDRRSASPLLHKVQIEIISSTYPRSFVCGVLRHKDAGVSPKLLMLEMLDVTTRTRVPVTVYEVDDLGKGVILVTIPPTDDEDAEDEPSSIDSEQSSTAAVTYFATVGLTEDGLSEEDAEAPVVAEHSLIVSFPALSAARTTLQE